MFAGIRILILLGAAAGAAAAPAAAQTAVLFDGRSHGAGQGAALLAPAVVTGGSYALMGRLEFGLTSHASLFGQLGAEFDGGATGLAGLGWSASLAEQSRALPLNIGLFNSWVFPLKRAGPDALITLAPVLSHRFGRPGNTAVTPYGGAAATLKIGAPGTDVNALLGVKLEGIAARWDFIAEVQAGDRSQLALGFFYRF